jgi:ABC-type sugar transport system permease subunit
MTDTSFYGMIGVTVIFVVGSVVLQIVIGFAIAWLIDAAPAPARPARWSRASPSSAPG